MLILTRRTRESLKIGGTITVKILAVKGNQVCIGIKAPDDVSVDRKEVYGRKHRERKNGVVASANRRP